VIPQVTTHARLGGSVPGDCGTSHFEKGEEEMPVSQTRSQKKVRKVKQEQTSSSVRSQRKAPGTRMGTWEDWRGGDSKAGKVSVRHGNAIRDGR